MSLQEIRKVRLRALSDELNRRTATEPAISDERAWENMQELAKSRSDDDGRYAFVVRQHQVHFHDNGAGERRTHVVGPAVAWIHEDIEDAKDVAQNTNHWWEGFGAPPVVMIADLDTGETWEPTWSVRKWTRGEPLLESSKASIRLVQDGQL